MDSGSLDFSFHWDGGATPWQHLHVAAFTVDDRLGAPYEARITLHARHADDEVDPADLIGKLATLRIATGTEPAVRFVHGLVVEATEFGASQLGMTYEVLLLPPIGRLVHRRRSRIFLEKTLRQILEGVLTRDAGLLPGEATSDAAGTLRGYRPPQTRFALRLQDSSRLNDPAARPYCVQYEESDLDFIARLLEEEGISLHHEHTEAAVVLVLADHDGGRQRLDPFLPLSPSSRGRHLDSMRVGHRLRPTRVRLVDVDWQKPGLDLGVEAQDGDGELFVAAYPGRYSVGPALGAPLARARLDRCRAEAQRATAKGACRLLGAGTIFALVHPQGRYEGEYLVTRAEMRGSAEGEIPGRTHAGTTTEEAAFEARVECVRRGIGAAVSESRFRPPLRTPRPRILGTQTAIVCDEPGARGAEIHVGGPAGNENGCVRLRFPWDTDAERHAKEPASCWVRVSQAFAGAGGGALWHPRVGTEVIVEFLDGDPDQPIVIGRVYNGAQRAPAAGEGAATVSTLKSLSSPGGSTWNELSFEDAAGKEEVRLFAGRDWTTEVGNDRVETVRADSMSTVKAKRREETGGHRSAHVGGSNTEAIDGNEAVSVGGRQEIRIGGAQEIGVAASRKARVGGDDELGVGGAMTIEAGVSFALMSPEATIEAPKVTVKSTTTDVLAATEASMTAAVISAVASGEITMQGAGIALTAKGEVIIAAGGSAIRISASGVEITGGSVKVSGGTVDVSGSMVKVN